MHFLLNAISSMLVRSAYTKYGNDDVAYALWKNEFRHETYEYVSEKLKAKDMDIFNMRGAQ